MCCKEIIRSKGRSREVSREAAVLIRVKDDGGLDRGGEKWLDSLVLEKGHTLHLNVNVCGLGTLIVCIFYFY